MSARETVVLIKISEPVEGTKDYYKVQIPRPDIWNNGLNVGWLRIERGGSAVLRLQLAIDLKSYLLLPLWYLFACVQGRIKRGAGPHPEDLYKDKIPSLTFSNLFQLSPPCLQYSIKLYIL